jgi:hypothetical protein
VMAARGMATVTRVAGDEEGDGEDARGWGVMVVMGHGLCVSFCLCGETTKISWDQKKVLDSWSIDPASLAIANTCSGGVVK